jgi:hypothetical protein
MENLEGLDVHEAQEKIREYLDSLYVRKPIAPQLKSKSPTVEELKSYSEARIVYEKELENYMQDNDLYNQESNRVWSLLEEKIKEDSGLNDIPKQYRDKVYSYAYQQGHSSGYGEVYNYLIDLVNIFD